MILASIDLIRKCHNSNSKKLNLIAWYSNQTLRLSQSYYGGENACQTGEVEFGFVKLRIENVLARSFFFC